MTTEAASSTHPPLTPLEDRAIRRFEHDRTFYERCYTAAGELRKTQPAADLGERLQDAMRALQAADEAVLDDETLARGARYLGTLTGVRYEDASVPFQEGLKAGVRGLLAAMESTS